MNTQDKKNIDAQLKTEKTPLRQVFNVEERFPKFKSALSKVVKKRLKEFEEGFNFVCYNIDKIGLGAIEEIAYPNDMEILFDRLPTMDIVSKISGFDKIKDESVNIRYIISENFIQGMEEASKMLLEKSEQSTDELIDEIISKAQQDMPDGLESVLWDDE